ncbi:MAG: hypothetical protein AMS21_01955 [Gemmatimonas sp. SG8_38_2]|nr:MAG: hypothetical protein AMS21_01955 [Gemmatimonas sp. SG8_38_2]
MSVSAFPYGVVAAAGRVFDFLGGTVNVTGTTHAGLRLNADGSMDQRTANITYSAKGDWVTPTVTSQEFSVYFSSAGVVGTDAQNTWLQIGNGTAREWWHNNSGLDRAYTIYLSFDNTRSGATIGSFDGSFTGTLSVP